jgi:hypothetical protein
MKPTQSHDQKASKPMSKKPAKDTAQTGTHGKPVQGSGTNRGGRPSLYKPEVIDEICERLSKGEPLAQICRDPHIPNEDTVNTWRSKKGPLPVEVSREVNRRVARARKLGFDAIALDCLNIADDNGKDTRVLEDGREVVDRDHIQRAKLRVDTRLKLLACWDPTRYGNKVDLTSKGKQIESPTHVHITREVIGGKQ